ncbi:MAG: menaquinone-dependent protoporphyrinogen IX dehydrogenase [Formivibrio sp.]|nr:menaquinone-dependent protoporphyrinogen IX dehydrogenase [Formivibrio sp.]
MSVVLLLYASREGQTRRICECMAEVVRSQGLDAQVRSLSDPDIAYALAQCERLIVGASIHYGRLPPTLYRFIAENHERIEALSGAFFCVNLTARKPGKDTPEGSAYVRTFLRKSPWKPARMAVFAGALYYTRYVWYDRMMIRLIMWITGGPTDVHQDVEFTDWERVRKVALAWVKV